MNIVLRAIAYLDPPKQVSLARACHVFPQAVTRWVRTGKIPASYCIAIERATNGAVTRYELREDVFGPDPSKQTKPSSTPEQPVQARAA